MVITSAVPTVGLDEADVSVVVELERLEAEFVGQAFKSLSKSSDPSPLASSYPVVARYADEPVELQYAEPAVHSLLPLVMSWNAEAYVVAFDASE
jgi:hypothetical protein